MPVLDTKDILETIQMIQDDCLDVRTTTMGISLLRSEEHTSELQSQR